MYKFILFLFFMCNFINLSYADRNLDTCKYYFRSEHAQPKEVMSIFSQITSINAVYKCTSASDNNVYFMATDINIKNGISYYYFTQIFQEKLGSRIRWNILPPLNTQILESSAFIFMCEQSANCRLQNDPRFVQTSNVTLGSYRKINTTWNNVIKSEKLFEESIQSNSTRDKHTSAIKLLRSDIFNNKDIPKITSLSFVSSGETPSPKYRLSISNKSNKWDIDFDFTVDGMKFDEIVLVTE